MAEYTPSDGDVRWQYVVKRMHDGATRTHAEQEYTRWLAAHDYRVHRDAAREALDGLAAEAREGIVNRETTWGHGQSIASAAETYRDTQYPEETP